jgi:hypothetical protein
LDRPIAVRREKTIIVLSIHQKGFS